MHSINPGLRSRIPEFKLVEDVGAVANYSYQVKTFTVKGFICIGDAHRFIDLVFSFGLNVSMKELAFAAEQVVSYLEGHARDAENPLQTTRPSEAVKQRRAA